MKKERDRDGQRQRTEKHQIYLRDRRRGIGAGQGDHGGLAGAAAQGQRAEGGGAEAGPLHQRRPRHDEPVPARRGVCDRGRRGNGSGPWALRAVHRRGPQPLFQPDDRQGVLERAAEGAPRRIPRIDGAGNPPHHGRDQAVRLPRGTADRRGRGDHRDRRHDRRHRIAAVHRGGAPDLAGGRAGEQPVHPRDAGAVPARLRGAQIEADAAFGQGAAGHGREPEHHRFALRRAAGAVDLSKDRAVLQRAAGLRDREPHAALPV